MGHKKLGLLVAVTVALLAVPVMGIAASDPPAETQDHASVTVFDLFELSPEQFAKMMSTNGE
jgi:hypothetical protein